MNDAVDVFFSYKIGTSGELVKQIVQDLEKKGVMCFYCERDGQGLYARKIMKAIRECKAFVLIANDSSLESEDCLNEIELAFERLRQAKSEGKEDFIIFLFMTQNVNLMNYDAGYYMKRFTWIDATIPPMEEHVLSLVDGLCSKIEHGRLSISVKKISRLRSVFQYPKKTFVGRQPELTKVTDCFNNGSHCVVLYGMGGIGKSEVAKKYAIDNRDKYSCIIFAPFNLSIKNTIIDDTIFSIDGFGRIENESDDEYFERKLCELKKITDERTLIIVDASMLNRMKTGMICIREVIGCSLHHGMKR